VIRTRRPYKPAAGQLWFIWDVEPAPTPVVVPMAPPAPFTPTPKPKPKPRVWTEPQKERQTDRWVQRRAACLLCKSWPAPFDHVVSGRLVVLCGTCSAQPNAYVRVAEVISEDWSTAGVRCSN
jgi:hypothetical protein